MNLKKWMYNVTMEEDEPERTVREILSLADEYAAKQEWQAAQILYARASETSTQGQLKYARFLTKTPGLENMSRKEQLKKAEILLLRLEQNADTSTAAEACFLLADLYRQSCGKEVSALGYQLRGIRLNRADNLTVEAFRKKILRLSLTEAEADSYGCYLAGMEASLYVDNSELINWACYFLQIAVEHGKDPYVGAAALRLAELYQDTCPDAKLAAEYLKVAADHGNPDILTRR